MIEVIEIWIDYFREIWVSFRWPIIVGGIALWSYFVVLVTSIFSRIRLRLRLLGPHFFNQVAKGRMLGLPMADAKELVMILATSMSSKDHTKHATGHGQFRGALEFSTYIQQAYGRLNPLAIKLSKDPGVDDVLEQSSRIVIGGPKNNPYLRQLFANVTPKLEATTGDKITLGDNKITLQHSSGKTEVFEPEYKEGTLHTVYGIVVRANTGNKGRRMILAAGTKTQGTLAACQFFTRNISIWRSLRKASFVGIVKAKTAGSGLEDKVEEIYFEGFKD